jgi:class 3 adenylate cyclase/tetratricopeptide (TPR) repeat protein
VQATLTVLFTDAVASTEALARLGDERFGVVQQGHLGLLRNAVAAHEGREVKSLGDGLMVVFSGAADALACAVAMQQAVDAATRRGDESLPLRVGVALGDVDVADDGDCHGTAVVEAARVCAAAGGGQILGTETVRLVAGSRGGHVFTPLGPVELKGLGEPVSLVEVGWAPVAEGDAVAPVPLPPRLAVESSWTFVGRSVEIARIDAMWQEAVGGARRVALLGGEPGEGKTRLAREVAAHAHEQGALVLFGRVDEDLAVAYQPFAEALRHYLASVDEMTREHVLALRGGVLARLVPELVEEQPQGQVDAWAIYEGLVDWLVGEAAQRPIVLVLDDIHWGAKPTLGALMHLVRSERLTRILIVGTYRDTELARTHPLVEALADLRREEGVERLAIRGLGSDGVEAFVQAARGDVLDEGGRELAELLVEQTQGNPFFVGQVLRHLAESGAVQEVDGRWVRTETADGFVVPEGVREVVGRRISRLSPLAGDLLTVAAVAGPEFDTSIVAQVAGHPISEALDGFDQAVGSRLVLETDVPGRLRFAHALVRQTLEDELTTLRRVHLHRDIANALEARSDVPDSAVAELAHHFAEAAVAGEGERAAHYAERAAVQALDRGAPEQAADLLQRALDLFPADADPDGLRRDRLYAQLATCWWTLFELQRLEDVIGRWLALGRTLRDDVIFVSAASWLVWSWLWRRVPEPAELDVLVEALDVDPSKFEVGGHRRFTLQGTWCETDPPALRAMLLGRVSSALALGIPLGHCAPSGGALALAEEALLAARRSTDAEIIDETRLVSAWAFVGTPDADSLLREGQRGTGNEYTIGGGWILVGLALARLGQLDDLRSHARQMSLLADQSGDRLMFGNARIHEALEALARGRFDEAHAATEQVLASNPEQLSFQLGYALLTISRLLSSGRPDEARPIADLIATNSVIPTSHLTGAVAVAQGDLDTPRTVLTEWHAAGRPLPADIMRSGWLWGLTECAQATGDRDAARHLYDHVAPYNGQFLLFVLNFLPASAAFTLGQLAETLGEHDRALTHYTDALTLEESCGTPTLAARTRQALARLG